MDKEMFEKINKQDLIQNCKDLSKKGCNSNTKNPKTSIIDNFSIDDNNHNSLINSGCIEYFQKQYIDAMNVSAEWELGLETRYCEDDILTIMGMLGYLENIERGFGHLNDEALFKSERRADSTGELYDEAVRGFALSKKYINIRRSLKECKRAL
jgi:hypothetical protein